MKWYLEYHTFFLFDPISYKVHSVDRTCSIPLCTSIRYQALKVSNNLCQPTTLCQICIFCPTTSNLQLLVCKGFNHYLDFFVLCSHHLNKKLLQCKQAYLTTISSPLHSNYYFIFRLNAPVNAYLLACLLLLILQLGEATQKLSFV